MSDERARVWELQNCVKMTNAKMYNVGLFNVKFTNSINKQ